MSRKRLSSVDPKNRVNKAALAKAAEMPCLACGATERHRLDYRRSVERLSVDGEYVVIPVAICVACRGGADDATVEAILGKWAARLPLEKAVLVELVPPALDAHPEVSRETADTEGE